MLEALIHTRLITQPAIWGKLPGHADFVCRGMRRGETDGWLPWLARNGAMVRRPATPPPPAAFVLPPGTLSFARRRFTLGVITPSRDSAGRDHALLVYQLAHPRWVQWHFARQAQRPRDWLFWLARAVERHTSPEHAASGVQALASTVDALWQLHAPDWRSLWASGRAAHESHEDTERRCLLAEAALTRRTGPMLAQDAAMRLRGVHCMPWADWPQRLFKARTQSAFWQQDMRGGFVNASNRFLDLWEVQA